MERCAVGKHHAVCLVSVPRDRGPDNGKYIFDRHVANRFKAPRNFRVGNYYSSFDQDHLNKNPKLVQNPNYN